MSRLPVILARVSFRSRLLAPTSSPSSLLYTCVSDVVRPSSLPRTSPRAPHCSPQPAVTCNAFSTTTSYSSPGSNMATAQEGQIIELNATPAEFKKFTADNKLVVVDFYATWCGPCTAFAPIYAALAKANPNVKFVKVDVDKAHELAAEIGVMSLPTFVIFKDGEPQPVFDRSTHLTGAQKKPLEDAIKMLA